MASPARSRQHGSNQIAERSQLERSGRLTRLSSLSTWQLVVAGTIVILLGLNLTSAVQLVVRPLALLFAAIIIGEALSPLVERMSRRLPRSIAIVLPYIVLVAIIAAAGWLFHPTLVNESERLVEQGPELVSQFQATIDRWDPSGEGRITEMATSRLGSAAGALSTVPFRILSSVLEVVLIIAMSIYWLFAKPGLREFTLSLFPTSRRADASDVLDEMGQTIGGYVRAELLTALLVGVITWIGLSLIGVEYALVLAVIATIGELIPVIGPFLSAVPALAVALLDSPVQAAIVLVFFLVLQQVESNILMPNIMHRQADIHPLLAIFSLFVGGTVGGILGALVSIPLAGALKVLVVRVVAPAIRQWSGAPEPPPQGGEPDDADSDDLRPRDR